MKTTAVLTALAAACIAAAPGGAAVPRPAPAIELVQPAEVPVPASVIAAHPNGQSGVLSAGPVARLPSIGATPNADERVSCWRAGFSGDNSGWWGSEQENINPYWCGNGYATRGVDTGWHWQSCSWIVSCEGESGVGTWYGCPNGCSSIGQQIVGHFRVDVIRSLSVDITVAYELYGNGGYWSWSWHN